MEWEDTEFQEPERLDFAKFSQHGDAIEGVFLETRERKNDFGKNEVHALVMTGKTDDGTPTVAWVRTNQRLLAQVAPVKRGQRIRIEYVSDQPNDGVGRDGKPLSPTKLFRVRVAKSGPAKPQPQGEDDIPF